MDSVSLLNLHCQKHNIPQPIYSFEGDQFKGWNCSISWNDQIIESPIWCPTKKQAKETTANQVLTHVPKPLSIKIPDDVYFLIDGDQRMDCWKWLLSCEWSPTSYGFVYISPTCPKLESHSNIVVKTAKTSNRDSADAMMLIDFGAYKQFCENIIFVSSDHILTQAAQDYGMKCAYNLSSLQEIVKEMTEDE